MTDYLKEMHLLLNKIHSMAERDHQELVDRGIDCQLKNCKHNYIYLDEKYHEQRYPIPIIEIMNKGDIGYNLDKIFFEFSFNKEDFLKLDLKYILNNFEDIEIYGGEDCLIDLYEKGDAVEDILEKFDHSDQECVMVCLYFDHDKKDLLELFFEVYDDVLPAWYNLKRRPNPQKRKLI